MDRHIDKRLVYAWWAGVFAFIYACAIDWDHIWVWLLDTVPPLVLYTPGRAFHTTGVMLLYALVVSIGITAFIIRQRTFMVEEE